jgi:hypothetical protein
LQWFYRAENQPQVLLLSGHDIVVSLRNEYSDEGMYGTFWNSLLLLPNKDKDEYAVLIHCILFIQGGTHDRRQKYFSIEVR